VSEQPKRLTAISYGGGVQSTAMLVLAAQRKLGYDVDVALFANVGDDSEHPDTLRYFREVSVPFAQAHAIQMRELHAVTKDGERRTLYNLLLTENTPSIPIRLEPVGMPANRSCTNHFKVQVIAKYLKEQGATSTEKATVCIGISTDEIHRADGGKNKPKYQHSVYPLIELGLSRADCQKVITDAGLPLPRKSACFFCPYTRGNQWGEMRRDEPELFERACAVEDAINAKRGQQGKPPAYLSRLQAPLRTMPTAQDLLPLFTGPDTDTCDEGYCWT
jgi:PP-loop superfamily ATP-utilizing enzyme